MIKNLLLIINMQLKMLTKLILIYIYQDIAPYWYESGVKLDYFGWSGYIHKISLRCRIFLSFIILKLYILYNNFFEILYSDNHLICR